MLDIINFLYHGSDENPVRPIFEFQPGFYYYLSRGPSDDNPSPIEAHLTLHDIGISIASAGNTRLFLIGPIHILHNRFGSVLRSWPLNLERLQYYPGGN